MATVLLLLHLLADPPPTDARATVIVVVGAPGTAEYGKQFEQWAARRTGRRARRRRGQCASAPGTAP